MSKARNHEIDLLRGIACAAVVVFHFLYRGQQDAWIADAAPPALAQAARYGYLGVHLFFIISGYVIFMSMQGSTARGFVASRAARLYPAYWVAALLTTAVSWGLASELFPVRTRDLLINLTMLTHWLPLGLKVEYVDGAYWSLAVEFQFYLLMLLVMRAGWLARVEQPLTAWLALSTLDFFKRMYYPELWLALDWAPLFSAGILFYRIRHHGLTRRRYLLLWWSFVLALGHSTQPWEMAIGAPGDPPRSAWVVACALTAFFGLFSLIAADRWQMRGSALTVWAGALTYPVYLLHQNIGYMLLEAWREALPSFPLRLALVMAVVLVAAWAVHRGVERPLGPMLRRWIDPSRTRGRRSVRASALQPSS